MALNKSISKACTADVANADWVLCLHDAGYELLSASSLDPTLHRVDQFIYRPCAYTLQTSCMGVGGLVYAFYIAFKLAVIVGAHCAWRWDEAQYRIPAMRPVMWVLERTISTPATHWAHHAITNEDGVGHYKGNFGNLLFIWDMMFGTAKITRQYPAQVGLIDGQLFGQERWQDQMFYPVMQSHREHSALKFGGTIYEEENAKNSV